MPSSSSLPPGARAALASPARANSARAARARVALWCGSVSLALGASLGSGACFSGSDGLIPPALELYFPTGIAISPGRNTLYVANSDFDIQYSGGTVHAVQLGDRDGSSGLRSLASRVSDALAAGEDDVAACATIGSRPNTNPILHPGPCEPIDYEGYVRAYATVGAFANAAVLVPRLDGPGLRLFVSVRGDPSVTYFDVVDDRDPAAPVSPCGQDFCLSCDASGVSLRCDASHLIGTSAAASIRGLSLPVEPSGLAVAPLAAGDALVVPHLTSQSASLIVNRWSDAGPFGPSLEYVLSGLPEGPSGVVHLPVPELVRAAEGAIAHRPAFVLSHRNAAALSLMRFDDDARSQPPRPFLTGLETVTVSVTNDSSDGRGMAVDASERQSCEAKCAAGDLVCLRACVDVPLKFYLAGRKPSALIVGTVRSELAESDGVVSSLVERLTLEETIPLPFGAAQVAVGSVIGQTGALETRVFALSFDSRSILVYDPRLRRIDAFLRTGRGPFGVAFDTGLDERGVLRSYLWVTQFTDSYLAAIDLDTRRLSFGTPIVSLGPPLPPRGEQ